MNVYSIIVIGNRQIYCGPLISPDLLWIFHIMPICRDGRWVAWGKGGGEGGDWRRDMHRSSDADGWISRHARVRLIRKVIYFKKSSQVPVFEKRNRFSSKLEIPQNIWCTFISNRWFRWNIFSNVQWSTSNNRY